jgi:hypothetical protein
VADANLAKIVTTELTPSDLQAFGLKKRRIPFRHFFWHLAASL